MKELARQLCDYLLANYGDLAFVTPVAFAAALRSVGRLPDDASPDHIKYWISDLVELRFDAAPPSLPGINYREGGRVVIETGRGRGSLEANLTIPHEFGESLQNAMNTELAARGLASLDWDERAWDRMSLELISPMIEFRRVAREKGLDSMAFNKVLSFQAVVYRMKEAFDDEVPLFAIYAKNASKWARREGFEGNDWRIEASSWTRQWLAFAYSRGRELLRLPRRGAALAPQSLMADVRLRGNAILAHTTDRIQKDTMETVVIFRRRCYGRQPAQVLAVGVAASHAAMLQPQIALLDADERRTHFNDLFGEG